MQTRGFKWSARLTQAAALLGFAAPVAVLHLSLETTTSGAIASALGVLLGGFALQVLARQEAERYRIFPTTLIVTIALGAAAMAGYFQHQNDRHVHALVADEARQLETRLNVRLVEITNALRRFATRLEIVGLRDRALLDADGRSYLEQVQGLRRLGIATPALKVIWYYPAPKNHQVPDLSQDDGGPRREVFLAARAHGQPVLSRLIPLRTGEPGFIMPVPITAGPLAGHEFYGTIAARALFTAVDSARDLHFAVRDDDAEIYTNGLAGRPEFAATASLRVGFAHWDLTVSPTDDYVRQNSSGLALNVAIVGTLLALLLGLIAQIWAGGAAQHNLDNAWRNAVLNGVDSAIISTDADGIIQTFNPSAERLLGYAASELVGVANPGLFHVPTEVEARARALSLELGREIAPGFDTFIAKTTATGHADESEWTFLRKDGSSLPVTLTVSALRGGNGRPLGYIGIVVDLTERRRAEQHLRTTMSRFGRVIESTGAGILERTYETRKVIHFDPKARAFFGLPLEGPVTLEQMYERIAPDSREQLFAAITAHVKDRTPRYDFEIHVAPRGDQPERWVRSQGQVRFVDGKPDVLTTTMTDVTAQVLARRKLEAALDQARAATDAKSAFLANMSHEIRTPLNGILGLSRQLEGPNLDAEQRENIESVIRSGENLLTIINDILDFAKLDAGKMDIERLPFDLASLMSDTQKLLAPSAREKNIGLHFDVPSGLAPRVRGDRGRLGQVLVNLIGNAIKFTGRGSVTVVVHAPPPGGRVRFEVIDTGIGITSEAITRMFQAFSQADVSTTRRFGGTGLGLSISKKIVDLMRGEIGVESEPGRGSTFWFEVPLEATADVRTESTPGRAEVSTTQTTRILVAEDNVINQKVAFATLKKLGYVPHVVSNGLEAIEELARAPYALVLMDCQMPTLDGYEATRRLRSDATCAHLPIIAMTAHVLPGERERCLAAGMTDYITKPFDVDALHAMIERHLKSA